MWPGSKSIKYGKERLDNGKGKTGKKVFIKRIKNR
jgi:hypothetical protein